VTERLVAVDGMGGHPVGEVASVSVMRDNLQALVVRQESD
jgi:hypothetical protein